MDKIEQKFIGVWELDEWVVEKPNGDKTFPFSGNVDGFLIYHSEGWMSATLMQKNRDEVSLEGDLLNTTKNYFLAANGYVSYAGEFNADDINVYHNIKTSLLPQWVGTTLTRRHEFTLKNKTLTLSAESNDFKDFLVWKKV